MHRVLPALAILALAGCATRGSVRQLQTDLGALRAEVAALEQIQDRADHDARRALAELRSLEDPLRELRTRLERTATEVDRLGERIQDVQAGIKDVRAEFIKRPPAVGTPTPVMAPTQAPERPPRESGPRSPGSAETAYSSALATFRAREHGQAVLEFLDFLTKHPKHPLVPSAQYWIGEAYYVQRDYRQALTEFQKVVEMPGRGAAAAAEALLKMGLCYTNLREPGRAQQTWERVIREHPDTEAAARVRSLLRVPRTATRP